MGSHQGFPDNRRLRTGIVSRFGALDSEGVDPRRKRTIRLTVALTAAVLLAGALIYTSFSASSPAKSPGQLLTSAVPGRSYQLTGKVVPGYARHGDTLDFRVRDRHGQRAVPVRYT